MIGTKFLEDRTLAENLLARFLRYVRVWTTSDRASGETPTSDGQWDLARLLRDELTALGIADVALTEHCYVVARLPASSGREKAPSVAFLAHLDTADDVSGKNVRPIVTERYDGGRIEQSSGHFLDPSIDADLARHIGDTIVCSDGSTLLGADDKAGVAEIMTLAAELAARPDLPHGPLEFIFTPDEETGKGLPCFPSELVRSRYCYTLDGSALGEVEIECFNAWKVDATFKGRVVHIGHAKGKLANAVSMAAAFVQLLPRSESPEATEGRDGFYSPMTISGDLEQAAVEVFLRDFDEAAIDRRLRSLEAIARAVEAQFPPGSVELTASCQYRNMRRKIDLHPEVYELLEEAARRAGLEPVKKPIRGGTDGARLTEMGIPTPNVFAGGHLFHSRSEWASLSEMVAATQLLLHLATLWAERRG